MTANSPPRSTPSRPIGKYVEYGIAGLLLLLGIIIVVTFFERLPIEGTSLAIDWQGLWTGLRNGQVTYGNATGLRIAPWDLPLVLPLGFFSLRASWGLLVLLTTAILVISVRRRGSPRIRFLSIVLLISSFPAIRHAADGNLEGLVIAGVLLTVYAWAKQYPFLLATGLLIATAKPQETWLLAVAVAMYALTSWPTRRWIQLGALLALIAIPTLLLTGSTWFSAMGGILEAGSLVDSSLGAALSRMGIGSWFTITAGRAILIGITAYVLWIGERTLSREKAAMLICLSLLNAPYAAGNSFLTILAIGIIPFLQSHRRLGIMLIVLTDLPYLLPRDVLYWWSAYYWTAMLLLVWAIFCWQLYKDERNRGSFSRIGDQRNHPEPVVEQTRSML